MKTAVAHVETFMRACGQETPDVPQMTKTAELYFGDPALVHEPIQGEPAVGGLVGEEIAELARAWGARDDVEVLDGALDVIWTIIAGLRALGFPIVDGWLQVAASNLAKIDSATGAVIRRKDGKILKPEGWQPPNLRRVLDQHGKAALMRQLMGAPEVKAVAPGNSNAVAEFAATWNGIERNHSAMKLPIEAAKQAGLVIIYGESDDLIELDGAITDEQGCYEETEFLIDAKGLLPPEHSVEREDLRAFYKREESARHRITAHWNEMSGNGIPAWTFTVTFPHATFHILEDGWPFCRAIVFDPIVLDMPPVSAIDIVGQNASGMEEEAGGVQ